MTWDQRNLADTVHAIRRQDMARSRCSVWRPKAYIYWRVDEDGPAPREATHTNYHEWTDRRGGLTKGARCRHCRKTLAQIMVPFDEVYPPPAGSDHHLAVALRTGR